ncbi:hypothetical protein WLX09_15765 [Bordetella bronchiseptica]
MTSVQHGKSRRQAPVAQTALDRARADVQSDLEHEAKVLLKKSGTSSRATATRQAARLAMVVVSNNLERLVEIRCDDEEWDEKDVCVDMAVDLALKMTRQLCAAQPATFDQMAFDWAQIYSIIDLANRAFSRPETAYGRFLSYLASAFDVLGEMVELADVVGEA